MGFRVWAVSVGLGFKDLRFYRWLLGFGVYVKGKGLGFGFEGLGFQCGLGFKGLGLRVWGLKAVLGF